MMVALATGKKVVVLTSGQNSDACGHATGADVLGSSQLATVHVPCCVIGLTAGRVCGAIAIAIAIANTVTANTVTAITTQLPRYTHLPLRSDACS